MNTANQSVITLCHSFERALVLDGCSAVGAAEAADDMYSEFAAVYHGGGREHLPPYMYHTDYRSYARLVVDLHALKMISGCKYEQTLEHLIDSLNESIN